jgi:predicted nucleotidyltransferase
MPGNAPALPRFHRRGRLGYIAGMSAPPLVHLPPPDVGADPTRHPAMRRFAEAVRALYGERVDRIVLYGSRARGDAREESDWDVAVFLHELRDWWGESEPLAKVSVALMDDTGAVINPLLFEAGGHLRRTPLMHEIRRDGLDL